MAKPIDNPYYNIFIIFICTVIGWVGSINSIRTGDGMAALFMVYFPLIVGLAAILIYLLSRLFIKKYNWIITLVAGLFLLFFGISAYFRAI